MVIQFHFWIEVPRAQLVASIRTHIVALKVLSPPIAKFCNPRTQAKWLGFPATSLQFACTSEVRTNRSNLVRGVLQVHPSFLVPQLCPPRCKCMPTKTSVFHPLEGVFLCHLRTHTATASLRSPGVDLRSNSTPSASLHWWRTPYGAPRWR